MVLQALAPLMPEASAIPVEAAVEVSTEEEKAAQAYPAWTKKVLSAHAAEVCAFKETSEIKSGAHLHWLAAYKKTEAGCSDWLAFKSDWETAHPPAAKKERKPQSEETKLVAALKRAATKAAKAALASEEEAPVVVEEVALVVEEVALVVEEAPVVVEEAPVVVEEVDESAPQLLMNCVSCKHDLPLPLFQKMTFGKVKELKCCEHCRRKQRLRTEAGGHNIRHNQKAKEKRQAAKAAREAAAVASIIPVESLPVKIPVKKAKRVYDLGLVEWALGLDKYLTNERGDVLSMDGEWIGRWNGTEINTAIGEPKDVDMLYIKD